MVEDDVNLKESKLVLDDLTIELRKLFKRPRNSFDRTQRRSNGKGR